MTSNLTRSTKTFATWTILLATITLNTFVTQAEEPGTKTPRPLIEPTEQQFAQAEAVAKRIGVVFHGSRSEPETSRHSTFRFITDRCRYGFFAFRDEDLKAIPDLPFSFILFTGGTDCSPEGLKALAKLKNLAAIVIMGGPGYPSSSLTDEGLKEISKSQSLSHVTFINIHNHHPGLSDQGMEDFSNLQNLTELRTSLYPRLDKFKNLVALDLDYGTCVSDERLREIAKLKKLIVLHLTDPTITDAGLKEIATLENLTKLWIGNHKPILAKPNDNTHITEAGLKEFARLNNLTVLGLCNMKITDAELKAIGGLTNLKSLWLHYTDVSNVSEITDAGLKELANLKKLSVLDLANTKITNAGLTELVHMTSLTELDLQGTRVTDTGMQELAKCKGLAVLHLEDTAVTPQAAETLRKVLPNCKVIRRE